MKSLIKKLSVGMVIGVSIFSCQPQKTTTTATNEPLISKVFSRAEKQYELLAKDADQHNTIPRSILNDGITTKYLVGKYDWTQGFFPGTLWYLYEYSDDDRWKALAEKYSEKVKHNEYHTGNHDVGFIINCSFGNGLRIENNEQYKEVIVNAAKSLSTRFDPKVGVIKSWDVNSGWQSERGWQYPVIIDNMMNLELLFKASELSGDPTYKEVALKHADKTMKYHFRDDFSSYHVVDYDSLNGEMRSRCTAQGYSNSSAWARGQAWGLYGYLTCYRFTKDEKYLDFATKIADFIIDHPSMPEDMVPYWDYNDPKIPNAPRDASAGAVTASALFEIASYSENNKAAKYIKTADKILNTLSNPSFMAEVGENNYFLLKHSVGSIPHGNEIDKPLNYADYYYLEALLRKQSYDDHENVEEITKL